MPPVITTTVTTTSNTEDDLITKEIEDSKTTINKLNDKYTGLIEDLDIVQFWRDLGSEVRRLTTKRQIRIKIRSDAESLERIIIKVTNKVKEYQEAEDIGNMQQARIAKKEAILFFGQVFRRLDDVFLLLNKSNT
ncbi:MAG: hypothetical protein M3Y53_05365 [Thermoproteota archaeon]|nr:hypothetical protein [Thermoproteota archaeon]